MEEKLHFFLCLFPADRQVAGEPQSSSVLFKLGTTGTIFLFFNYYCAPTGGATTQYDPSELNSEKVVMLIMLQKSLCSVGENPSDVTLNISSSDNKMCI